MTKDAALTLALEALERSVSTCFTQYSHEQVMSRPEHFINQAITVIKEALAQPEEQQSCDKQGASLKMQDIVCPNCGDMARTWPKQERPWVGLTDAEAQWLYDNCRTPSNLIDMAEAKLKEKNYG